MYILNAKIENIRSIRRFELRFESEECPGWHVLIGDNGAGKTAIVRALALALIGPKQAEASRQNWADWLSNGQAEGGVRLDLAWHSNVDRIVKSGKPAEQPIPVEVCLERNSVGHRETVELFVPRHLKFDPERYIWGDGNGWFSASYGPFRRFAGGDKDYDKLFYSHPRLARHLSAFGEDVALTECLSWLQTLHVKQLERDPEGHLLDDLTRLVNDGGLLPHGTTLEKVTSGAVYFRDGNGCRIDVEHLSDGYRSVLSLTFELVRQLVHTYGRHAVFRHSGPPKLEAITVPGVVLIDEIDAHLHPTWQRRIGKWFTERFPKLQFIVTTHSPLVCQAAENGSVWRLPTPGVQDDGGRITGTDLKRLIFGNVLEAYGTEAFGNDVNRSESSKEKMKRLAQLNQKSLRETLTDCEQNELTELRSILPTSAGTLE